MADTKQTEKPEAKTDTGKASLTKFKYVGDGSDTGVNEFQSRTYYDIQFPKGVEVEVPDSLVHKLRTKDDMEEVGGNVPKTAFEKQRERETKQAVKGTRKDGRVEITAEELEELRAKAAKADARIEQVRADAKAGR